ncbi:MAG: NUDIX hydrolase [bacterium]|nr:NUDIX hydrolase [bacterium]
MQKIIVVSGPVIIENNKVLLNKHGDTAFWKFCGGMVENYEINLMENVSKEAYEEMGIKIKILDEKPFIIFTRKDVQGEKIDIILVHFLAQKIGEIKPREDIREWKWIDINNLPDDLAPNIIPSLKHFGFIK